MEARDAVSHGPPDNHAGYREVKPVRLNISFDYQKHWPDVYCTLDKSQRCKKRQEVTHVWKHRRTESTDRTSEGMICAGLLLLVITIRCPSKVNIEETEPGNDFIGYKRELSCAGLAVARRELKGATRLYHPSRISIILAARDILEVGFFRLLVRVDNMNE